MMANGKKKSKLDYRFLTGNIIKAILAIIAVTSFGLAFYGDQISKLILNFKPLLNEKCLKQFYQDIPPYLNKESLTRNSYPLCFEGFNVMYSGISKTPLWVAENLTPKRLSQNIPHKYSFHEEKQIPPKYRSRVYDYSNSGYYRWHMAPNEDMQTKEAQWDGFSLVNVVPLMPEAGIGVLRELETIIRALVIRQNEDVYVITGPMFESKKLKTIGQNNVIVPTSVFKAVYIPKTGAIGAYYVSNDNSRNFSVVSICYLEEKLGINLFPQLTEDQKRNTYKLPLEVGQVNVEQTIEYSFWDGESQCAEDVSTDELKVLQKKFKIIRERDTE